MCSYSVHKFPFYIITYSLFHIFYMYCCTKWFSINTIFLSITLLAIWPYFDHSPGSSFHCAIITSSDLNKRSQPSCTAAKPLTPLLRKKKKVDLRDETSLATSRLLGAEACIGNTTTCVNVQPSLSPANVSLQPRRRHNFAAYMGLHTTSLLS